MTKYATTDAARRAAMALLKSGQVSLSEVAELAGVSKQLAFRWITVQKDGKRAPSFDWQAKRTAYLKARWSKQLAKEKSAVSTLR